MKLARVHTRRSYGGSDSLVEVARLCVMLVMIVQFPVNHYPARSAVFALCQLVLKQCRNSGAGPVAENGGDVAEAVDADGNFDVDDEVSQSDTDMDEGNPPGA